MAAFRLVGLHEHERRRGLTPAGDEDLAAVDDVLVAVAPRERVLIRGVGAGLRLGERETADLVPRGDRTQEALALGLGAVLVNGIAEQRVVDRHHDGMAAAHARDLFHHRRVRDRVAAHPAPALGHEDPHETELAHPLDRLVREPSVAVDLRGDGAHFALGEVARHLADHPLLVGEVEVHLSRSFLNSWVSAGTTSKRSPTMP